MPGPGIELIGDEETAEVLEVMASRFLSRYGPADNPAFGAKVHKVEEALASLAGVKHGLALSGGGSAALWIAMLGLGIGPGDEVIVPGFTYVASISSIVYTGATPVLAEVDDSFCLDPADVATRITPHTKAILVVHMLGGVARLDELKSLADAHGIALIEDCAQAFGATYQGQGVGGIGTVGTFSFNEYKTITCGDGGALVTDDTALYERAFAMHDQGHAPFRLESKYAERPFLGMNFRMTELSGAVLLAQLRKLDLHPDPPAGEQGDREVDPARGPRDRVPDAGRPGGRPRDAPRGHPAHQGDRRGGRQGGRVDHAGHLGLARLQPHGPRALAADRDRQGLPVRLRAHRPRAGRVLPGHAPRRPTAWWTARSAWASASATGTSRRSGCG